MDSQKRLLVAVVLSVIIMLSYQKFVAEPRLQQVQAQKALEANIHSVAAAPGNQAPASAVPQSPTEIDNKAPIMENISILENEVFRIEVTDAGARVKQIQLKKFKDVKTNELAYLLDTETPNNNSGPFLLQNLFAENPILSQWKLVEHTEKSLKYVLKKKIGITITKEIFLHNSNYSIGLRTTFNNVSSMPIPSKYKVIGPAAFFVKPGMDERYVGTDIKTTKEVIRLNNPIKAVKSGSKIYPESPVWLSARGRYFSLALMPLQEEKAYFVEKESKKRARSGIVWGPVTIEPGDTVTQEFLFYAGPNDSYELAKVDANLGEIVTFGKLNVICMPLLKLLRFFNGIVKNYGLAIILLTLTVGGLMFPLTRKSLRSMKEMQAIQPEVEKLRKAHKDNPQKLNKETMELYKKHKINPLGGCLPMFFQMPIFISLYQVLARSIELKGASFLWIKDLSEADAFFKLPMTLPVLGEYINILPILMAIAMFLQQKTSQVKAGQTEQQRMMAVMMPLLFGFMFYNLPAGLVLYWFTNTTSMILLQEFVLKIRHATPKTA